MTVTSSSEDEIQNPTLQNEEERRIYLVTDGIKSLQTKKTYLSAFNYFLKMTVESDDLVALLDYKPSVIESKIIRHIERLKERKISYSAIHVSYAAIVHFFEINDINLNTRKIKRFFPQDESDRYSTDRPYSMDEIKQILNKCDIRSRVIILLMASTGMRLGALHIDEEGRPGIRVGDLKLFDEFGLYMISVYPWSKADRYYTFCTPE
ncbi:MAG: hypothetical protein WBL67_18165 [Nitrososphaeraceae archaeon]